MHDKALVQAHQVADKGLLQQIVADGDARRWQAGVVHRIVDERRVHDDVAVVSQKQISVTGLQVFDTGIAHAIGRLLDGAIDIALDARL